MNISKLVRWTVVGGLIGATALAGTFALAFPAQAAELSSGLRGLGIGRGMVDWWALLAEELGISVDQLEQAVAAANEAAIDQLVDEGVLTAEEADLARAAAALREYLDHTALVAGALGMSQSELEAAIAEGSRLPDLLEEQGLDRSAYIENLQAARAEAIQQAVEDGVISQAQADELQSRGQHGFGPRHRPGMGPGGFGPGHGPGIGPGGFGPGFGPESFGPDTAPGSGARPTVGSSLES